MASQRQILANRRNARRSTGPRTDEGKARSSLNSIKHGAFARTIDESDGDPTYEARREEFVALFEARNETVERLARATFVKFERLARIQEIERASAEASRKSARARFYLERADALEAADAALPERPYASFLTLIGTRAGCERLLRRRDRIQAELEDGTWSETSLRILLGLLGHEAEAARAEIEEASRIVTAEQGDASAEIPDDSPLAEALDLLFEALEAVREGLESTLPLLEDEEEYALDLKLRMAGLATDDEGRSITRGLIQASNDFHRSFRELLALTKADLNAELEESPFEDAVEPIREPAARPAPPPPPPARRNEPKSSEEDFDMRATLDELNDMLRAHGLAEVPNPFDGEGPFGPSDDQLDL